MDRLWADGWRHFGPHFFRQMETEHQNRKYHVKPLRIHLPTYRPGKRFRAILRRNSDLHVQFEPTVLTAEDHALFAEHKVRFQFDVPESLTDFLGLHPSEIPCRNMACRVRLENRLVAASFLDLGEKASSSVYGSFALAEAKRSLGYFTMLCEIEFATRLGMEWYYPGYAYHEPSFYDYKKRFQPYQWLDWQGGWRSDDTGISVLSPNESD
jgi:arginine-tRNA-protein transferase